MTCVYLPHVPMTMFVSPNSTKPTEYTVLSYIVTDVTKTLSSSLAFMSMNVHNQ